MDVCLTLSKELSVAVRKKIDDGSGVLLGAADVLLASLGGDERPAREVSVGSPTPEFGRETYSFSMLIVGAHWWLRRRWKRLMPTFPK